LLHLYRAAEMDDVLLQAMWRRPRGCLRELMQNARTKAAAGGYQKSVAEVGVLRWCSCCVAWWTLHCWCVSYYLAEPQL
jgi:hypothetical protein